MKKQIYLYLLAGLISGWLLSSLFTTPNQINGRWAGMMGYRGDMASSMDRHFIEQMIPHHQDAITMANSALKKSNRAEIKTLAQNILKSQGDEIDQMTQWYDEWFGKQVPRGTTQMGAHGMKVSDSSMHMGLMGDETDILSLDSALDFDKEFIRQMIPHHQMAVMMATMLENGTSKPEMKQLANNIITDQNKEIASMRSWYATWYK